jgi:hypothetical protein
MDLNELPSMVADAYSKLKHTVGHPAPDGRVELVNPPKFRTDFRVCRIETGSMFKLRVMNERYDYFNEHAFGNQLTKPKFEVSKNMPHAIKYGFYQNGGLHGQSRIVITAKLLLLPDDTLFNYVMLHEMAHQFVREVLNVLSGDPHGEWWQETMRRLGLPDTAKYHGDVETVMTKQEKLEKQKTVERIVVHNITVADIKQFPPQGTILICLSNHKPVLQRILPVFFTQKMDKVLGADPKIMKRGKLNLFQADQLSYPDLKHRRSKAYAALEDPVVVQYAKRATELATRLTDGTLVHHIDDKA